MFPILKSMVAEDVSSLTSGARTFAERVAYKYAAVERRHRFRFLFDPLRMLTNPDFLRAYAAGGNPFPLSVEIDPSNACNHDCGFCIYHSMHQPGRGEQLPRARMFSLIDELHQLGCRSILFVGGGEPMTHPATVDAIERAAGLGIACGLVTNGSLVCGDKALRLRRTATYVRFSLDAASAQTHLDLHRRDDFEMILANLRALAAAPGSCTVGTGYFINDRNVREIVESAAMVKGAGADYIQFKTYSGMPIEPRLHNAMLEGIEAALELASDTFDIHVADRIFVNHAFQVRGYSRCHFQAMKTVVNADGSVYLCAQKRTDPSGRIGNILHDSLARIWNGVNRREVVDGLDLESCPYCVHDPQNKMLEFLTGFQAPHRSFY